MKQPLISFVVPIYNVEPYLKRCLDSLVNQTYKNLEIILVDDGSPDNCAKICDEYSTKDDRIKVIHKQNGGLMAAWIDGVKISSGEYVYFVDSDDWIEPDSVQDYIDVISTYEPNIIINDYYIASSNYKEYANGVSYEKEGFLIEEDFIDIKQKYMKQELSFYYYRWNKLFKRELILNNIKYCDKSVAIFEDINIVFAVMLDIKNVYILKKPGYNYFVREDSMIRESFKERCITDREKVLKAIINI